MGDGQAAVALAGVLVLALERVVRLLVVVATGDRLPLASGAPVRAFSTVGGVVVPVLLALAGQPPLGWHGPVPRAPGVAPRRADALVGGAGAAVAVVGVVLDPALAPLLLLVLLPLPGQAGGRLVGAVLPAATRAAWRAWERRTPPPLAPALVLAAVLVRGALG